MTPVIVRARHFLGEIFAPAHQKIDDVVAYSVIERMAMHVVALALLGQRILDNLGQHGVRAVGHQHDTVGLVSRQMRRTSSCSVPRVSASSAENGSSISMIFGSIESARAMPTRCFMPPESSAGRLCSAPVSPTRSMNFCECAATCAADQRRCFDATA